MFKYEIPLRFGLVLLIQIISVTKLKSSIHSNFSKQIKNLKKLLSKLSKQVLGLF